MAEHLCNHIGIVCVVVLRVSFKSSTPIILGEEHELWVWVSIWMSMKQKWIQR